VPVQSDLHEQQDENGGIPISSVILANGYDTSKSYSDEYGYGRYKNVVTSMEYERILSASGLTRDMYRDLRTECPLSGLRSYNV